MRTSPSQVERDCRTALAALSRVLDVMVRQREKMDPHPAESNIMDAIESIRVAQSHINDISSDKRTTITEVLRKFTAVKSINHGVAHHVRGTLYPQRNFLKANAYDIEVCKDGKLAVILYASGQAAVHRECFESTLYSCLQTLFQT